MLSTPCTACEFATTESRGCEAGQFCVNDGNGMAAPGFCRLFGKAQPGVPQASIEERIQRARQRSSLAFDLVVWFDERRHTSEQLRRSVTQVHPHCRKLIVIDTTGSALRTRVAREVLAEQGVRRPYSLECPTDSTEDHHVAIDRAQRLIQAPYFLVLEAGRVIHGITAWADHIRDTDSRVIHWYFPIVQGETVLTQPAGANGAWITAAYRQIGCSIARPAFNTLAIYESQGGCGLSWLLSEAVLE